MEHTYEVGVKGVILNEHENKVLFLSSIDDNGKEILEFPGGRMQKGETIEQTVTREIKEEIANCGDLQVGKILSANPRSFDLKNGNGLLLICVTVKLVSTIDYPRLSNEHTGYVWLSKADLSRTVPISVNGKVLDNPTYVQAALAALL